MYAMMIKQAMMGMGINDPIVLEMVDRIGEIGFANFHSERVAGASVGASNEADAIVLQGRNTDDSYRLVISCEKIV